MADMTKRSQGGVQDKNASIIGYVWDGIEEYNNLLSCWWLWIFYITIVWVIGYMIVYPAWLLIIKAMLGLLGHFICADVVVEIVEFEVCNDVWFECFNGTEVAALCEEPELECFVVQAGEAVFAA